MSQGRLSLSIGRYPINPQPQNPQLISKLQAKAILKKDQITNLSSSLKAKIGANRLPFILIETSTKLKDFQLAGFSTVTTNDHHYVIQNPLQEQQQKMLKKFQKVFQDLTTLDNSLLLDIEFYDFDSVFNKVVKEEQSISMALTQRIKISVSANIDKNFYAKLAELAGNVSKPFAESPIMGLLPLLGTIEGDIQMQAPSSLQQSNQQKLPKYKMKFEASIIMDEQSKLPIKQGFTIREVSNVYVSFGNLGIIQISLETRYLAFLYVFMQ